MKIELTNIGIINNASVKLDGLTVIAGSNNSGKTTVGKALYSVTSPVVDLNETIDDEFKDTVVNRIENIFRTVDMYPIVWEARELRNAGISNILENDIFTRCLRLLMHDFSYEDQGLIDFSSSLKKSLECNTIIDIFLESPLVEKLSPEFIKHFDERSDAIYKASREFADIKVRGLVDFIGNGINKDNYARKAIESKLNVEFNQQAQNLYNYNDGESLSSIKISDGQEYFSISIVNNQLISGGCKYKENLFDKVFMIDDPYVVDSSYTKRLNRYEFRKKRNSSHREDLIAYLTCESKNKKILEELYEEQQIRPIIDKINIALPGVFKDGVYISEGIKINAPNLATGSKVFSIIKKIVYNCDLNERALLILDEPESHLHPDWINLLAEIVVLLVKMFGATILMTTHSPNFLLAIDTYMRKYGAQDKCHFYMTEACRDSYGVTYIEKTFCLDDIYKSFADSFLRMNALRKSYMEE